MDAHIAFSHKYGGGGARRVRVRALPHSVWFENVVIVWVRGLGLQRVLQQSGDDLVGLTLLRGRTHGGFHFLK